jgi:hypothetical protein
MHPSHTKYGVGGHRQGSRGVAIPIGRTARTIGRGDARPDSEYGHVQRFPPVHSDAVLSRGGPVGPHLEFGAKSTHGGRVEVLFQADFEGEISGNARLMPSAELHAKNVYTTFHIGTRDFAAHEDMSQRSIAGKFNNTGEQFPHHRFRHVLAHPLFVRCQTFDHSETGNILRPTLNIYRHFLPFSSCSQYYVYRNLRLVGKRFVTSYAIIFTFGPHILIYYYYNLSHTCLQRYTCGGHLMGMPSISGQASLLFRLMLSDDSEFVLT